MRARYDAATPNLGEDSSETVDMSQIFYDVAGPRKKQWVYGIKRKRAAVMPSITSCSSSTSIDQLRANIY